jgi:hypothetical protein
MAALDPAIRQQVKVNEEGMEQLRKLNPGLVE